MKLTMKAVVLLFGIILAGCSLKASKLNEVGFDAVGWYDHFGVTYAVDASNSKSSLIIEDLSLFGPPTIVLHPKKEDRLCINGWNGKRDYGKILINGRPVAYSQSCFGVVMLSYPKTKQGLAVLVNELLNNSFVEMRDGNTVLIFSSKGFDKAYEEKMKQTN